MKPGEKCFAVDRLAKIRYRLDAFMRGLEIGPSYNPCMPKAEGWSVETIDHLSKDELIAKFAAFAQDLPVEKIEDVDWIWNGEPLDELLGAERHSSYDYIVASHVIEHIPDLLGFFISAERLLKDGGTLSLVIPDKRHCFDLFKPTTLTPDLLEAHESGRRRHSKKTANEWFAYSSLRGGRSDWDASDRSDLKLTYTFEQMRAALAEYERDEVRYLDCHAWYFVPSTFTLVVEELRALGLIRLDVAKTFDPAGCEFYASLRKAAASEPPPYADDAFDRRRAELLHSAMRELSAPFREDVASLRR